MDDLALAARIIAREPNAMEEMVRTHHSDVYRFLRHLTRHRQEAEDLTQQTFLQVLKKLTSYTGSGSLRSWIFGIAFREFTSWRRRRFWLPLLADPVQPSDPFSAVAEAEALLAALAKLPKLTRATFLLHYVEQLSISEIADSLEIPEGTVKSRLYTARTLLRTHLEEETLATKPC